MPKAKHHRKAGGKTVPHPGRARDSQGAWDGGGIGEAGREGSLCGRLPPQKDTAGLPLFGATTNKPPRG
jgi:hypothetical protein